MAPVRETYVPVPGIDYIESASERKVNRHPATAVINSQIPPPSSSQKTPSKATSKPKTPNSSVSAKRDKTSRLGIQDSAVKVHASIDSLKSKKVPSSKKSSATKIKAPPSRKTTSKPAAGTGSKVLSAELVTVSDDQDSDAEANDDRTKANRGRAWIAEKGLERNGIGRSNGLVRTNGLSGKGMVSSGSSSSSEMNSEEDNDSIDKKDRYGINKRLNITRVTNGSGEKRARSASSGSSSGSSSDSDGSNNSGTVSQSKNDVPGEARKRKSTATSSSQAKTGGSPAKRARSSRSNSDYSGSVSSEADKMDIDESASNGIGPSAQPDGKVNGTASRELGSARAIRHDQSLRPASSQSSDTESGSISNSSNSGDSSTTQSDIAEDDKDTTKTTPSSRINLARPASTSYISENTATTAMPTITPPPPPEPLSQSSLSSFSGKQLWHITLPANIPIESIRTIPSSALSTSSAMQSQTPIIVHDGAEYVLSRGFKAEERDAHVLVAAADDDGRAGNFKRLRRTVNAVWHVRLAPKLPNHQGHVRQSDDGDASAAAGYDGVDYDDIHESSDSSEPKLRPLPQGLKMRWLPSGCGPLSDNSENDSIEDTRPDNNAMNAKAVSGSVNASKNHSLMQGLAFRNRDSWDGTASDDDQAQRGSHRSAVTDANTDATNTNLNPENRYNDNNTSSTDKARYDSKSKSKSKKRKERSEMNGDGEDISSFSNNNNLSASPKPSSSPRKPVHSTEQVIPTLPSSARAPAKADAASSSSEVKAAKRARKEERRRRRREQKALQKTQTQMQTQMQNERSKINVPLEPKASREPAEPIDKQEVEMEVEMEMDRKRKKQEKKKVEKGKKREEKNEKKEGKKESGD